MKTFESPAALACAVLEGIWFEPRCWHLHNPRVSMVLCHFDFVNDTMKIGGHAIKTRHRNLDGICL